jgi:hypothetical protein
MIIIKTAKGALFVNENDVTSVAHNKDFAHARIDYKNRNTEYIGQVENIYYTNETNVKIQDDGLMLHAAISDSEYYKQLNESTYNYLKRMAEWRSKLEYMVVKMHENPDTEKDYRERFVKELREQRKDRPGTLDKELDEYRTMPYYSKLQKDRIEKGKEVEKEFARMAAKIEELEEERKRLMNGAEQKNLYYKTREDYLMNRSLWQRIINYKPEYWDNQDGYSWAKIKK